MITSPFSYPHHLSPCFIFLNYASICLFIFWLWWVFVAVHGLFCSCNEQSLLSSSPAIGLHPDKLIVGASLVAQMLKTLPAMQETQFQFLGQDNLLEKGKAPHSSILAWKIPWTEEPGELQSMGLQRVRHDWATNTHKPIVGWKYLMLKCIEHIYPYRTSQLGPAHLKHAQNSSMSLQLGKTI